nr:MAG TPA: hypothetical protein [Bacteriophage sp.]DAV77932.1 MAG TPA: hypothetical protein [Bacteriophage sp.]
MYSFPFTLIFIIIFTLSHPIVHIGKGADFTPHLPFKIIILLHHQDMMCSRLFWRLYHQSTQPLI